MPKEEITPVPRIVYHTEAVINFRSPQDLAKIAVCKLMQNSVSTTTREWLEKQIISERLPFCERRVKEKGGRGGDTAT